MSLSNIIFIGRDRKAVVGSKYCTTNHCKFLWDLVQPEISDSWTADGLAFSIFLGLYFLKKKTNVKKK